MFYNYILFLDYLCLFGDVRAVFDRICVRVESFVKLFLSATYNFAPKFFCIAKCTFYNVVFVFLMSS